MHAPIWAVSCSGSHWLNTFFVTVNLTFDLVVVVMVVVFLSYHQETILLFRVTVTLTFDQVTWELIGVTCQSWSMYLWSLINLGVSFLQLSSGNHFTVSSHHDLDLWPSDLNINRGHLPVMINVPMKFHDPRRKRSWVIIQKPFYCFESLWPWPLT